MANVIESLEIGMKVLTQMQKSMMNLRYPGDGSETRWKVVTAELIISASHIRKIFDYSIMKLISAAQITIDVYREVMEVMQGRGG